MILLISRVIRNLSKYLKMFGKKICGAFLIGVAFVSGRVIDSKSLRQEASFKPQTDSIIQTKSVDENRTSQNSETPIVVNSRNNQPQVKQLFESFATFDSQNRSVKSATQQKLSSENKNIRKKEQKSDQHKEEKKCVNPETHPKQLGSHILGDLTELKGQGSHKDNNKTQNSANQNQKELNGSKKNDNKQNFNKKSKQTNRHLKVSEHVSSSQKKDKMVTVLVKTPNLPKFLKAQKQENQVSWMISQDSQQQKPPKDGKNKFTRLPNQKNSYENHLALENPKAQVSQKQSQKENEAPQFLYAIDFETPKVSSSLISQSPIDNFNPPIEIHQAQAVQNRLNSQYAVLSTKEVPEIWREVDLKPGQYRIYFEWQASEAGGEIQVFWNHRIVGSFRSFDLNSRKQAVHIKVQKCREGKSILKFATTGHGTVGIDNIQIGK